MASFGKLGGNQNKQSEVENNIIGISINLPFSEISVLNQKVRNEINPLLLAFYISPGDMKKKINYLKNVIYYCLVNNITMESKVMY